MAQVSSRRPIKPPRSSRLVQQRAADRPLPHRQVDEGGHQTQSNRQPPDDVVVAGQVIDAPTQPGAQKAAELVAQEHAAAEHRQMLGAEDLRHDGVGGRHRRQPQQAHQRSEQVHAQRAGRQQDEDQHGQRAQRIDAGQHMALGQARTQHAGAIAAKDVEQPDQHQRAGGHVDAEAPVLQIAGQMHTDEDEMESADKVAERQPLEAAVAQGLAQRLANALAGPGVQRRAGPLPHAQGQGQDQQRRGGQHQQRLLPAQVPDQRALDRDHRELAERAGGGGDAEGPGAFLGTHGATQNAVDDGVGAARLGHADHHAGAQREPQRRRRHGHQHQPEGIEQAAADQHLPGAEAVRQHAGDRTGKTPGKVLHGDREREGLARPAALGDEGLQPEAEAVAYAHRQRDDQGAAQQHLLHAQGARVSGGGMHRSTVVSWAWPWQPPWLCRPFSWTISAGRRSRHWPGRWRPQRLQAASAAAPA
mmetsp:Transcript_57662/g.135740  ORF Transcript_57662/g.135740 Transcript_57662/m.135740 type:complete len:475 (+) Transcript_57662:2422-3846(+)